MAPETLEGILSKSQTYNNKTDVWSFGITVWEMYSQGIGHIDHNIRLYKLYYFTMATQRFKG